MRDSSQPLSKMKVDFLLNSMHPYETPVVSIDKTEPPKQRSPVKQDFEGYVQVGDKFVCVECRKSFDRLHNIKTHYECVHLQLRPFECRFCEAKFKRKQELQRHVISRHLNE